MKFLLVVLMALSFNFSAFAQDPGHPVPGEAPSTADDMTLVGSKSGKTVQVEDQNPKQKKSEKKSKKKHKAKKDQH
jgi:hypothetical protein